MMKINWNAKCNICGKMKKKNNKCKQGDPEMNGCIMGIMPQGL